MEKVTHMTKQERERLQEVEQLKQKKLTYADGSKQLGMSIRRSNRSMERYREEGDEGLTHRSRGAIYNREYSVKMHREVIELYQVHYGDYGPTLFTEMLQERHSTTIGIETVRQWLAPCRIMEESS